MAQFRYVARNGEGKLVDGVLECNDRAAAIRQVELQRFTPIKIEPLAATASKSPAVKKGGSQAKSSSASAPPVEATQGNPLSMSHNQLFLFTEQLANLLGAGMTLDEALSILVRRMKHPKLAGVSGGLHQALVDGRSLSQALRDYPRIFSALYVNMVAAGEASGALAEILKRLVQHLSDLKGLRDRVQQALLYPAMLVLAGIVLITLFITVMVPQLTAFFKEAGGNIPAATQILLSANAFITHYWWLVLGLGGLLYMGFRTAVANPRGRMAWDTFIWKLPVYSLVLRYRYYAQFSRTLGTLIENGVTLLRALELLESVAANEFVREKMIEVRHAVVDGATLSTALGEQKIFPELFNDMLSVGEQTGRFGPTMNNIAAVYERELDKQVQVISTLIPPLVMMAIAAVVGFVVFGILSAVFSLTRNMSGGMHH
jgi:type II secretory pathway component PulF